MKLFILPIILIFQLLVSAPLFAASNSKLPPPIKVLLLVPGFFNSFAPEYFSEDVVQAFQNKGLNVQVVDSLNPVGSFEENGERLFQIMARIESDQKGRVEFDLVGHSAGGLYSLYVANKKKFNIKHVFTVATPFKGIEFIDELMTNSVTFMALTKLAHLESLKQFTPEKVKTFISEIRLSPKTKVMTFGGYQPKGIDITDARNISIPLRVTATLISGNSDGVVSYDSAIGAGVIKTSDGKAAFLENNSSTFLALEHWEQVLDANSFVFLGIRNISYVRDEQRRFYSVLADLLSK